MINVIHNNLHIIENVIKTILYIHKTNITAANLH